MLIKDEFSVGVCVYNEENNIEAFLTAIETQRLSKKFILKEIIVVASGCTDSTVKIVKQHKKRNKKIKLYIQKERQGKVSAVNLVLLKLRTKIIILQSADTVPAATCYNYLLKELIKPEVGLTAGKILPKDNKNTLCGYANYFRWKLHHKINLKYPDRPKVGELIAFKKIFERIPPKALVDEASVEPLIHLQGYKIKYVPKAIIYNQGPSTIREYLSRRRSIYAGHYITKRKYAYEVVTYNPLRVLNIYITNLEGNPKYLFYALIALFLEVAGRITGYMDIKFRLRNQAIWKIAKTTKQITLN